MFLFIVLIKVLCFFIVDPKHRRGRGESRNYGQFQEEAATEGDETEAVVGVYFKIMDKVTYRVFSQNSNELDSEEQKDYAYMIDQRQCRLCLQYFKQGEELMKIPICEHIFHINCLRKWLMDFQKCPVCDSNIIRLPEGKKSKDLEIRGLAFSNQGGEQEVEMKKIKDNE